MWGILQPHLVTKNAGERPMQMTPKESLRTGEDEYGQGENRGPVRYTRHGLGLHAVAYSNQSPRWRLVQPCLWESGSYDTRLSRLDRSFGLGHVVQIVEEAGTGSKVVDSSR